MSEKIAVLLGGNSLERNISLLSGKNVLKELIKLGINAYAIDTINFPIFKLKNEGFTKVFIALHGKNGEDGIIQSILESLKIPYTGSGVMSSAIAMDKIRTKLIWKGYNLPVSKYIHINNITKKKLDIEKIKIKLGTKLFIKPNNEGSSIGSIIVKDSKEIKNKIKKALSKYKSIIIEPFIEGKEYTVSILENNILPIIKIYSRNLFYDYSAKYISKNTKYICPCGLDIKKEKKIKKIVKKAWNILGCTGFGRIDLIIDNNNKIWLLEANTIPGMTNDSLFPLAAKKAGIEFKELILKILTSANLNK
ncbi:D-alanine--D-alanine ligase B [Buchnera aphidicola (Neophyllaphis podocarpi)]|uniref:D-alanine--D-alanine ligase n=1 Tax=Buchnera aphidicola TaxID=9 RepID=UPI003464D57C